MKRYSAIAEIVGGSTVSVQFKASSIESAIDMAKENLLDGLEGVRSFGLIEVRDE